ncbi:unnamed protein product [Darwinula stevensoni]|uniref:Neutral ceramidase n=1 Tax=Darwinula stevensoni TaxID=69355 RepID=A0A7R8X617_9CRUS|nr:unnamed protein product [Darwinula stevensoni]CAG0881629.1 unnamed protein product [Darwinula stevensoni]
MFLLVFPIVLCLHSASGFEQNPPHLVGIGIGDVTGPAADVAMMGYAKHWQETKGIHLRQFARTFIACDDVDCIVFCSADIGMMGTAVKQEVVKRMNAEFGGKYHGGNVILSGTHTHSGPSGFLSYALYNIPNRGFVQETFDAIVEGILDSIREAHRSIRPGKIYYGETLVPNANVNRSPTAYLANPEKERKRYEHDVDKVMQLLQFESDGEIRGVFAWFAVHPTSMNNTNMLISSDNKGVASLIVEKHFNGEVMPGKGPFIAAFPASNLGDTSPNLKSPVCIKTGEPCDPITSACKDRGDFCVASGPGKDMQESTWIIGDRQAEAALEIIEEIGRNKERSRVRGAIKSIGQYVDMTNYQFELEQEDGNKTNVTTCKPAMGYSFAAGTTDGYGSLEFTQGEKDQHGIWRILTALLDQPTEEQKKCHAPKPILFNTGDMTWPYPWQPEVVETTLGMIGNVAIAALPGEFTTMAGRRIRDRLRRVMRSHGKRDPKIILAGLSNTYTSYVATFEEYQVQRYEGASTIFGPYTNAAYIDQFEKLADALFDGATMRSDLFPPNLLDKQISLLNLIMPDHPPVRKDFGDCSLEPEGMYRRQDSVHVAFVSGNPRNDRRKNGTYLLVEKLEANDLWVDVATDASWETKSGSLFLQLVYTVVTDEEFEQQAWNTGEGEVTPATKQKQQARRRKSWRLRSQF